MQEESKEEMGYQFIPVMFKCGHADTVALYGDDEMIAMQAKGMSMKCECPQCAFKRFGEWPMPSYEDAVRFARHWKINLPMLKGDEQDVRLATIIRGHACLMPWPLLRHIYVQETYALGELPVYRPFFKDLFWDAPRYPTKDLYRIYIDEMAKMPEDALACWLNHEAHTVRELVNMSLRYVVDSYFTELTHVYNSLKKEEPNIQDPDIRFEKAKQILYDQAMNSLSSEEKQYWEEQYKSHPQPQGNRKHKKSARDRKRKK